MSGPDLQEHSFVKVLYDFQYQTTEGRDIAIKKNEKLYLLQKTNADWWQVVRTWEQRSFYVPATYVREMSKSSRRNSEEDRDAAVAPLDGPKYKNMPKETSSAMRNVKKWLAGAIDSKQESSKMSYNTDDSHKHHAMDYTSRAELKVGLAAIKSKSLERDHKAEQLEQKLDTKERKRSKEMQKRISGGTINELDTTKLTKNFSTSPKSFDLSLDPFRKELESSLDRRRKKSDNTDFEKLVRENREQESLRDRRIRTKSSHSDDSHIESDTDERFLSRINEKPKKFEKPEQKLSLSLRDESSGSRQSPSAPRRNSRSMETDARQFCMRTERSLSPKPTYGRQLTIGGQITDDELDTNPDDEKILNDKRRTWAVEELMSELTQMCKDRGHSKKPNFQLKSTEIKSTFDPLDELTKELHEMNLQRSEGNTPQIEVKTNDFKSSEVSPSNISKVSINIENTKDLNSASPSSTLEDLDEIEDITEHSNISVSPDLSESSLVFRHPKQEKQSAFTFRTTEVIIPQSKSTKSPKSPKILDEYNEANILNDCSPDDSLDDSQSLSVDKQSHYRKRTTNEASHSSTDNGHKSPSYSNIKMQQTNKVKMRPKIKIKPVDPRGELKLTPSLEKLASEIQFIPAKTSDDSKVTSSSLNNSIGDICNDSGIHDITYKLDDSWDRKKILRYAGSFKTKREGRYFHRRDNSDDDDDDDSSSSVKKYGLKKSSTLHFTTIPDNYRRFRTQNDLASNLSNAFKRRSRSLSDLSRCLEEESFDESYQYTQESPRSPVHTPVPLPRTKIPALDSSLTADKPETSVNKVRLPVPRKPSRKKEVTTMEDPWERFTLSAKGKSNHLEQLTPDIDIESSTAVGFKTLLCTSDSGSDNCLQSKELLSHNDLNDDTTGQRAAGLGKSSSGVNLKREETRTRESPSEEQILSSNASSEALQSQSESEITGAFDATSQPSPASSRITQDTYECAINLPPGWTQKYDLHTDQVYFINEQGDRWFSSNDEEGKIYFFEENSNESSWVLPTIVPGKAQTKNKDAPHDDDSSSAVNDVGQTKSSSTSSTTPHTNQSIIRDVTTKKHGATSTDWPQLSFDGNMRILKEGPISRTKITENGKKLRKNWSTSYAVLTELFLLFFKDSKTFSTMMKSGQSPIAKPDISVDLNGALVEPGDRASSRKNVYMISTVLGLQVLIQSDNTALAAEWFQEIHGAIRKLPFSFKATAKPYAGPPEVRKISNSKTVETNSPEDTKETKKSSKVARSRSMKTVKRLDDSLEDLSGTVAERQTKIKARLRRFFQRRPTVESLMKNGIYKDEPAFGSYLNDVCPTEHPRVPLFVKTCIEVLESNEDNMKTDGLYRASGNLSQIQKIRLQVDQYNLNVLSQEEDVHVLTGALKLFFRELKEPLIPSSYFKVALNASMLKKTSAKVQCFRDIIKALPPPNHDTLQFLLKHLLKVTSYQEFNRMHIPNLAIVFGPTLMWPAEESANMALDLMQQNLVIECLLSEYNKIFK